MGYFDNVDARGLRANKGVKNSTAAIVRQGEQAIDIENMIIYGLPWSGASQDESVRSMALKGPSIGNAGEPFTLSNTRETEHGFKADVANAPAGVTLGCFDILAVKESNPLVAAAFNGWDYEGTNIVLGGIPVSSVPATGTYRPKLIHRQGERLSALSRHTQPVLAPGTYGGLTHLTQPLWLPNSSADYDHSRGGANVIGHVISTTGKLGHTMAPPMFGKAANGDIVGIIFGWWEMWDTNTDAKCFDCETIHEKLISQGAVTLSTSIDVGYTDLGGTGSPTNFGLWEMSAVNGSGHVVPVDGTINSISVGIKDNTVGVGSQQNTVHIENGSVLDYVASAVTASYNAPAVAQIITAVPLAGAGVAIVNENDLAWPGVSSAAQDRTIYFDALGVSHRHSSTGTHAQRILNYTGGNPGDGVALITSYFTMTETGSGATGDDSGLNTGISIGL